MLKYILTGFIAIGLLNVQTVRAVGVECVCPAWEPDYPYTGACDADGNCLMGAKPLVPVKVGPMAINGKFNKVVKPAAISPAKTAPLKAR